MARDEQIGAAVTELLWELDDIACEVVRYDHVKHERERGWYVSGRHFVGYVRVPVGHPLYAVPRAEVGLGALLCFAGLREGRFHPVKRPGWWIGTTTQHENRHACGETKCGPPQCWGKGEIVKECEALVAQLVKAAAARA